MRRRERVNGWMFSFLAAVLLLSMFFAGIRVFVAQKQMSSADVIAFSGISAVVTDRLGQTICENEEMEYSLFGNLIGYRKKMDNSIVVLFSEELAPGKVNPVFGYRSIEKEPRIMKTSLLPAESQQTIAELFNGKGGCCFAYNYETGEIYTALSFPDYYINCPQENGRYINRCFGSVYIPGSTMKIVTLLLATDQGLKVNKMSHECTGSLQLTDGTKIICEYVHGKVDLAGAIGKSCNCFFATVIAQLDLDRAIAKLKELGFVVNQEEQSRVTVGRFKRRQSSTNITDVSGFKNVWGLIGQGNSQANAIDMARIAGAIVNGGRVAEPNLVMSVINPNKKDQVIYEAERELTDLVQFHTAEQTKKYWKSGVDDYYYDRGLSSTVTYAKTGTAEQGDGTLNKLLIGAIEPSKTAFFIVLEDCTDITATFRIANKLSEVLPQR